ncbi:translation initiation factor [Crocinitomix catalasitica]|uniref:translation initiation factor n=1 Tax=Crocinitomix catalasitica TaxID=184607 RepID=UPI000489D7B1|nr:translation initiation factor [Crocinitomix catalasitica]
MAKKNKANKNIVYSTNPDFNYDAEDDGEMETLAPNQQDLRVLVDRKQRKGKEVTLVTGFVGTDDDLKDLGKLLKQKCGVGGAVKDGEIIIQGNSGQKILDLLLGMKYGVKKSGAF